METLGIGALSKLTNCNIETIRYYERIGLLTPPPRTQGGHRQYSDEDVKRLTFVRRGRELGFTLEEVRELLTLVDGGHYTCEEVKTITLAHIDDVRRKIADLRTLYKVLKYTAAECSGGNVPECPIIDVLFDTKTGVSLKGANR